MFPTNPTEGQIYKNKMWRSSSNSWVDSSAIVESGSNENGSYVKFSDGTMEQWGRWTFTLLPLNPNTSSTFSVTMPVSFVNTSSVITGSMRAGYTEFGGFKISEGVFEVNTFTVLYANNGTIQWPTMVGQYFEWHAIGRWRE